MMRDKIVQIIASSYNTDSGVFIKDFPEIADIILALEVKTKDEKVRCKFFSDKGQCDGEIKGPICNQHDNRCQKIVPVVVTIADMLEVK